MTFRWVFVGLPGSNPLRSCVDDSVFGVWTPGKEAATDRTDPQTR